MIHGAKYWNRDYYCQDNNSVERILGKLETCGPSAAVNCIAALCDETDEKLKIKCFGSYKPQPEDVLTLFMNEGRTKYKKMLEDVRKGVGHIPGNRIPQFYPIAVDMVFGIDAKFLWSHRWEVLIEDFLKKGCTIQLCFKKPGHYIAVLAYDDKTDEMIYNDPWAGHRKNKHGGKGERLTRDEFEKNTFAYCVIYSK